MKKFFLVCLFLLAFTTYAQAQTTYTPNLNLALPPAAPNTWGSQYNNNFSILDTSVASGGVTDTTCAAGSMLSAIAGGVPTCTPVSVIATKLALTADVAPAQITANQNDYDGCAVTTNTVCRITTDASRNITGFASGTDGTLLFLYNVGSFNAVLKNLTTSAAANQLTINADITIAPNQGIILQYDATSTKWRAASGISGGGAGQAADNDLTALAGFSGTGFPARTTTDTWAQRAMATASANNVTITNPLGVAGDPTWDVGPNVALTTRSFTATAGDFDLGASASFTFPKAPGAAPSAEGRCAEDTTAHRLKCNFGSGVVTLAITSEMQALSANLTALAGLTGANNAVPVWTSASAMTTATLPSCADSGGNHLNYDSTLHTYSCGTSSTGGLSGLTINKFLMATSASTADTSGNLSQTAGVVNASAGFTVGTGPFLVVDTSAIAATDKTWTALNFSGTIRPSTGVITAGHVLTIDANGLIIDGGVAGSGTWTDSSTSTGTNKTLVDAAAVAGTGNTITVPIRAAWDGGALITDEDVAKCGTATRQVINSGPPIYTFVCADSNSSTFAGSITLPQALVTATFTLTVNDVDSSSQHFAGAFKAMCRNNATTVNSTWGTGQTVDITMVTANNNYTGTTAAVTPNGTCSSGATLFWIFTVDATTNTDDGDARVIGVLMKQAS